MGILADLWADFQRDPLPGSTPNKPVRGAGNWRDSQELYDLLFVEFNDQGRPFDADAIDRVMDLLAELSQSSDVIIVLFVHGWKHGARNEDENVESLRRLLHTLGHTESLDPKATPPRRVVGIYVGWRALSLHWAGVLENITFWSRKEAALRVALGSVRELFARLRRFRLDAARNDREETRLVIAGHSFGGLIVHAAISEYLIESVAASDGEIAILPFGDMTILVNPAFEAARYYPLHTLVAGKTFAARQAPVFLSVTARNDWATGWAFPAGRHLTLFTGISADSREREANFHTMGHIEWMQTHELTKPPSARNADVKLTQTEPLKDAERQDVIAQEQRDFDAFRAQATGADGRLRPGWSRTYTAGAELKSLSGQAGPGGASISPENPFWVVRASPEIVNGHNGIFGDVFLDFLRQFLDDVER
jgi:hypothetical protein